MFDGIDPLMRPLVCQESLSEIREAFNIFDKDGNGYITASELRHFLSSLGYNMTEAELMDMMNKIGKNNGKYNDDKLCMSMPASKIHKQNTYGEVLRLPFSCPLLPQQNLGHSGFSLHHNANILSHSAMEKTAS